MFPKDGDSPDPFRWDADLVMDRVHVALRTRQEEPNYPDLNGIRCRHLTMRPAEAWTQDDVLRLLTSTDWDRFPHIQRITVLDVKLGNSSTPRSKRSYRSSLWEVANKGRVSGLASLKRVDVSFAKGIKASEASVATRAWMDTLGSSGGWSREVEADWRRVVKYTGRG